MFQLEWGIENMLLKRRSILKIDCHFEGGKVMFREYPLALSLFTSSAPTTN